MTEFICEWEVRLQSALAAGCQYSDAVLAFKLLHNSELDNSDIQQSKPVQIAIWTYDLYGPVRHAFDAGKSITWARGRGLGPGNRDFLGPVKLHRAVRPACHVRPKKLRFSGLSPISLAQVIDLPASKALRTVFVHELPGPSAVSFFYRKD